jgi:rare lipoprotein A
LLPGSYLVTGRLLVALAVCCAGCSLFRHPAPPPPAAPQVGVASWYGRELEGHRTASGDVFDRQVFSAAHPTLPLGTRARVTNLANGRSVVVRINDRGPFVRARTLDVSYAAARALGMLQRGTARVRIEVIGDDGRRAMNTRARVRRSRRPRRRRE